MVGRSDVFLFCPHLWGPDDKIIMPGGGTKSGLKRDIMERQVRWGRQTDLTGQKGFLGNTNTRAIEW